MERYDAAHAIVLLRNQLINQSEPASMHPSKEIYFSRSELLIESEARSAESSEARSAESRSDVARRRAQGDANLGQGLFIYLFGWEHGT